MNYMYIKNTELEHDVAKMAARMITNGSISNEGAIENAIAYYDVYASDAVYDDIEELVAEYLYEFEYDIDNPNKG